MRSRRAADAAAAELDRSIETRCPSHAREPRAAPPESVGPPVPRNLRSMTPGGDAAQQRYVARGQDFRWENRQPAELWGACGSGETGNGRSACAESPRAESPLAERLGAVPGAQHVPGGGTGPGAGLMPADSGDLRVPPEPRPGDAERSHRVPGDAGIREGLDPFVLRIARAASRLAQACKHPAAGGPILGAPPRWSHCPMTLSRHRRSRDASSRPWVPHVTPQTTD